MLNIFLELWKAQQENRVVIPELYFPDTFILDENHDFIWVFRSKQEGKILRKKKQNSSVDNIVKSLVGQNLNLSIEYSSIDCTQLNQNSINNNYQSVTVQPETPFATFSRLNDQGEIEIQHFNSDQIKKFFGEVEYKNALPRDSIFLQRYLRTDQNEIHNHFIKVVYNNNFIQIEKRRNCFFWQNLTENSNKPKDREYYNCLISYEGPEQFTEVEKINEYTANQLKYIVKQICIQLESIHMKERGKVKQISLIFKKINDIIYLLHCNEISFEREQHIPKLWRMSFKNPFIVPLHIRCTSKPLLPPQQNQIVNRSMLQGGINKTVSNQSNNLKNLQLNTSNDSNLKLRSMLNKQQIDNTMFEEKENKNNSIDQKYQMCISCGQGSLMQLQDVMKNKLLRIRIKRGVRENFNGLRPLYESQQKQEKALFDKYTTVKVCHLCFEAYQEIQKEDESQQQLNLFYQSYGYSVKEQSQIAKKKQVNIHKARSKSFNLVSIDQTSDNSTSLINGQFLTPIENSSLKRRKSVNQCEGEEEEENSEDHFDESFLKNINDQSMINKDQSFSYRLNENSFDTKQLNKSFEQKNSIQNGLRERSIIQRAQLVQSRQNDSNEVSTYNFNKRHHSFSKAQQINNQYYQLNKNLQYKFKELRSKSTQRSQNLSNILPQFSDLQNDDASLINDMSFIQKAHNMNSITPITVADQKTISEALNLLQETSSKNLEGKNLNNRKISRLYPISVGRQRPSINPSLKQQYQVIIQNCSITPISNANLNDQSSISIQSNNKNRKNNLSTYNVVSEYFQQLEDSSFMANQTNLGNNDDTFLKKFYQQQAIEKDKRQSEQMIEINSINNSKDYISINNISNNQCLRSEDILNKMRDINNSKEMISDSHEKIISDYNSIYKDQKYQVQLLKQKSSLGKVNSAYENNTSSTTNIVNRSRNSSTASKSTNNTSLTQIQQRNNSVDLEGRLLANIRYLEKQLQESEIQNKINNNQLPQENQKENNYNIVNTKQNTNNFGSIKTQQPNQNFQLPPKPVISQKSITKQSNIKIPNTSNPLSEIQFQQQLKNNNNTENKQIQQKNRNSSNQIDYQQSSKSLQTNKKNRPENSVDNIQTSQSIRKIL
ncbi:hypothetical protein TTHERM_00790520 (macronuclear) [Tetrahymena thermophila SB210]|uniref:Uncharacterized protein n=1 Tax=Tetrahymena thermophila (strain SB210) TaxID=312017 RepID=Q24DT5_TETTS|nr:hypothetical protein TTHERM_00790520 [Tetrahymena thermophila SB210]EAS05905.2 hypothetical protein TTHERM_00790520 [Tetrahymena thermophila SB210]|eukprot:XP_001026150.2 hypothetical protein TTHERM_00790520 [Tetrahymena thermophila SB210]